MARRIRRTQERQQKPFPCPKLFDEDCPKMGSTETHNKLSIKAKSMGYETLAHAVSDVTGTQIDTIRNNPPCPDNIASRILILLQAKSFQEVSTSESVSVKRRKAKGMTR